MVIVFFASLFVLNHNNMQYAHFNGLVLYLLVWGIVFSFTILRMDRKK
jgi:hypothetical protein